MSGRTNGRFDVSLHMQKLDEDLLRRAKTSYDVAFKTNPLSSSSKSGGKVCVRCCCTCCESVLL